MILVISLKLQQLESGEAKDNFSSHTKYKKKKEGRKFPSLLQRDKISSK